RRLRRRRARRPARAAADAHCRNGRRRGRGRADRRMTLRADAQRNLDRLLDTAAECFAEQGLDVSIDEIARRAGVGHGTVFRRFPTKDALRAAVIRARLDELLATAHALLEEPDAGAAVEQFVWEVADSCLRDRALFEGIESC